MHVVIVVSQVKIFQFFAMVHNYTQQKAKNIYIHIYIKLFSLFSLKKIIFSFLSFFFSLSGFSSSFFFSFSYIYFFSFAIFSSHQIPHLPPNSSINLSFCYLSQFFPTKMKKCGLVENHEQEWLWELICTKHWANIDYPNQQLQSVVFAA